MPTHWQLLLRAAAGGLKPPHLQHRVRLCATSAHVALPEAGSDLQHRGSPASTQQEVVQPVTSACCSVPTDGLARPHIRSLLHHLQQLHRHTHWRGPVRSITSTSAGHAAAAAATQAAADTRSAASAEEVSPEADDTTLQLTTGSTQLDEADIGAYYPLNTNLLPEAYRPFYQAFYAPRPPALHRKGGCQGLQAEQAASGAPRLMYRGIIHHLMTELEQAAAEDASLSPASTTSSSGSSSESSSSSSSRGQGRRWLLTGPAGSGKSLALLSCVEWARSAGWLVLYIPSAAALTSGGFFYKRAGPTGSGWDTLQSALHVLKSVADTHQQQLARLPVTTPAAADVVARGGGPQAAAVQPGAKAQGKKGKPAAVAGPPAEGGGDSSSSSSTLPAPTSDGSGSSSSSSGSLWDLVMAGLSTDDDAALAVDAVKALLEEMAALPAAGTPVLLAVDDYSALWGPTGYGRHKAVGSNQGSVVTQRHPLTVEDLNLASSLRLLSRPDLQQPCILAATSSTQPLPPRMQGQVPVGQGVQHLAVPRFSYVETAHALCYYHERGLLEEVPSDCEVEKLRALTNGNATELRGWCVGSTQLLEGYLPRRR